MKNLILYFIVFSLNYTFAQLTPQLDGFDSYSSGVLYRNKVTDSENNGINGSKYISKTFIPAEVIESKVTILMRYDAEKDAIEFLNDDKQKFHLIKDDNYKTINSKDGKFKYRLLNYTSIKNESINGYVLEIASVNNLSLLKRQRIKLQPEKKAKSSYDTYTPAEYIKTPDEYYLELPDKKIIPMPKNKKGLVELFPGKKEVLEDYFKNKKVDFKNEYDLINLIKIL